MATPLAPELPTTERRERTSTVGVAYPGDPDAAGTWSGTPASLSNAMRGHGVTVKPLRAQVSRLAETAAANVLAALRLHRTPMPSLPERARVSRTIALYTGREMAALRTRALRSSVRRAGQLDAVVQIGTGYGLPPGLRIATYEDMTVSQALTLPIYPEWRLLSEREKQAGIARAAASYANAEVLCFATHWAANSAIRDFGVAAEKTHVVGVGRNHAPRPRPREWSTPRFLFVGGDWKRKNGDAVVRSMTQVRKRFPKAHLDVVGLHPRLDADGVTGHGWLSLSGSDERAQLDRLFEQATCFVMPSTCEPAGISYVEAAAGGVPSIGSSVGGSADLIGDGGRVVDPHDETAILEAMLRFSDGETARAAGARALEHSHQFTWPKVADRILAALGF